MNVFQKVSRFTIVGAYNTMITWFCMLFLGSLIPIPIASVASQVAGLTHGYFTHRYFVFKPATPPNLKEWLAFNVSGIGVVVVNSAGTITLTHYGVSLIYASAISAAFGSLIMYFFADKHVFKKPGNDSL